MFEEKFMPTNISTNNFTEEEKILLLKIFKIHLPKDVTREKIDESFSRLQAKLKKAQDSNKESLDGGEFAELATVIVEATQPKASPFNQFNAKNIEATAEALRKAFNAVPWKSLALAGAKCGVFVLGLTPQSLAVEIVVTLGFELLMRVQYGNLLRGGEAAVHIALESLRRVYPGKLAQDLAHDAATAVFTVASALTKKPHEAIMQIEGAASKFFSPFSKELSLLAGKSHFHVKTPEQPAEVKNSVQKSTAPTPFPLTPTPFDGK